MGLLPYDRYGHASSSRHTSSSSRSSSNSHHTNPYHAGSDPWNPLGGRRADQAATQQGYSHYYATASPSHHGWYPVHPTSTHATSSPYNGGTSRPTTTTRSSTSGHTQSASSASSARANYYAQFADRASRPGDYEVWTSLAAFCRSHGS